MSPQPPGQPASRQETVDLGTRCLELLARKVHRSLLAERLHVSPHQVDYALKVVRNMGITVPEPEPAEQEPAPEKPRRQHRAVHKRAIEVPGQYRWQDDAACKGEAIELFFGPDGERAAEKFTREEEAKKVCAACPVETECLEFSIGGAVPAHQWNKAGTWGGLGEDERAQERRRRMRAASTERARELAEAS